jgi:hypothetical protein
VDDTGDGLQLHMSRMLLTGLITGIVATLSVAVFTMVLLLGRMTLREGLAGLIISTGLFCIAWLTAIVAHARDQVLRKITTARAEILGAVDEYDGKRETEAYLRGMRASVGGGDVRPLHLMPPPDVS